MANTKIPSELIDGTLGVAGITSSADGTAITIDSSERVGIGISPDTLLHVSTTGSGDKAKIGNGTRHGFIAVDSSGVSFGNEASQAGELLYLNEANGYASIFTSGSERLRVHSNGNTSIGDNHPDTHALSVADQNNRSMDSSATGQFRIQGNGYSSAFAMDGNALHIYHNSSTRDIILGTNETEQFKVNRGGEITAPQHPVFDVSTTATGISGDITFNTVYVNVGSNYSTSNGRFTAPVAGTYIFYTQFIKNGTNGTVRRKILKKCKCF